MADIVHLLIPATPLEASSGTLNVFCSNLYDTPPPPLLISYKPSSDLWEVFSSHTKIILLNYIDLNCKEGLNFSFMSDKVNLRLKWQTNIMVYNGLKIKE